MGREAARSGGADQAAAKKPVGVIDIGSNSIRLVVFEAAQRHPVPLFNEKVQCAIGRGLVSTGKLDPKGVERAQALLDRFRAVAAAMRLERVEAVSTAAVREAKDGASFVAEASRRLGVAVRVLSGEEEAALAAAGVLSGIPDAKGIAGDLGGGSLELIEIKAGRTGRGTTLSIGPLQLRDAAEGHPNKARKLVDEALSAIDWLPVKGDALYAVGGIWRSLARVHMRQANYPLHVLHQYSIEAREALDLSGLIASQSPKSLETMTGLARRRVETLPFGALVLARLIAAANVSRVVFSAYGLREGLLYNMLAPAEQAKDPLIEAARSMARLFSRDPSHSEELFRWTAPLFEGESAADARLRQAACLLSDLNWRVHPDYRGAHAFNDILHAPFSGIDHPGRIFLAQVVYYRYAGNDDDAEPMPQLAPIAGRERSERALQLGLALRLGHVVSASASGVLARTALSRSEKALKLTTPPDLAPLLGEAARKRFADLAEAFGFDSEVSVGP